MPTVLIFRVPEDAPATTDKQVQDLIRLKGGELLGSGTHVSTFAALCHANVDAQAAILQVVEDNIVKSLTNLKRERQQKAAQMGDAEPDLVAVPHMVDAKPFVPLDPERVPFVAKVLRDVERAVGCDPPLTDDGDDDPDDTDTYDAPGGSD